MKRTSPFVELMVVCLTYSVWGTLYAFPIYLPDLKEQLKLSQLGINWVGSSIYVSTVLIAVPLLPFVRAKLGDRWTGVLGACIAPLALLLLYLIFHRTIVGSLALALVAGTMLGLSTGIYFVLLLDLAMNRYPPADAAWVVGISSTFYACGGVVISALYLEVLQDVGTLLLLLVAAHAVAGAGVCVMCFINHGPHEKSSFDETLLSDTVTIDDKNPLPPETTTQLVVAHLTSLRSWLVAVILLLKVGIGTTYTTNLGSISASLAPGEGEYTAQIVLGFAASQAFGRILVMFISSARVLRFLLGTWYQPDPAFAPLNPSLVVVLTIAFAYMAVFTTSIYVISKGTLMMITLFFGVAYGAMWTESANLVYYSARPAGKHIGVGMGVLMPFGGIGTLVLNAVSGALYDSHAGADGDVCVGPGCYHDTWVMLACLSGVMAVVIFILMMRWRNVLRPVVDL